MSTKRQVAILLLIAGAVAAPMLAHHSIAAHYFMGQTVHVEGDVLQFSYVSPHAFVMLEAKDPRTGQPVKWEIEWAPVRRLKQRGVLKDTIKPGDHVIIDAYPSRDNLDHRLFMRGITRPSDGWNYK